MNNPEVSVIITTFNREKYIGYAIQSVLDQSFQNFELIVVDDGSVDSTREIVNNFQDDRIKYYYQENSGQNYARNTGIIMAQGEYIAYLDSDDVWLPEKLEKQVEILNKHPDVGLVYCGTQLINENNQIICRRPLQNYNGYILDKLLLTNFLYNGSCSLFRYKCLRSVGIFDCSVKRMTDWEFYLRFALYYRFMSVPEYLLNYRVHEDTMSYDFKGYEKSGFEILDKIFNHKDFPVKYEVLKNRSYAMRYRYMGKRYFENGYMQEAREYMNKSFKIDPFMLIRSDLLIFYIISYFPNSFVIYLKNIVKSVKQTVQNASD